MKQVNVKGEDGRVLFVENEMCKRWKLCVD